VTATLGAEADTFPKLVRANAETLPRKTAIREKDLGIWQTWTWKDVRDEVRVMASGFAALGLARGDKLVIIGDNRPQLYWAMVAAQALGAVPVPVYQDSVAVEMGYVLEHAGVRVAIAENQEQVDKVLEIRETYKGIEYIVYDEPRGLQKYDVAGLNSFEAVQELGRRALKDDPEAERRWIEEIAKGGPEDTAVILYTSGTTGRPKGVVLTVGNLVWAANVANDFDRLTEKEEVIAYLPMAWVGDHVFSYAQAYAAGYCVNCPESRDTVVENRREIGTTYAFAPPAVYERLITLTMVHMEDASAVKQRMFHYFLGIARRVGGDILDRKPVRLKDRLLYLLGNILVYGPLKNRFGLTRVRIGYTAGEAIGPEIFRFFRSLGINLKQLYGQTEASVYITNQPDSEIYLDTVGRPLERVEIDVDASGEVLYRSPGVFKEYYKNPEATAATKTPDGWVHSGDAGFFEEHGHLKIIDRAKDVGRLKDGSLFPPKYIENKLKFFPNIKEAVAFGAGRDYVACFINIDLTAVGSWAERNNVVFGSYQELAAHPHVYAMVEEHVNQVNRELAREERVAGCQIRRFLVLPKELDPDDGEITRTNKVRRSFIAERYAPLIEALYDPRKARQRIRAEVTFEDGRKGVLDADVEIRDVQPCVPEQVLKEAAE
jgi:long-chain acyl-CoA synthetase